MTKIPTSALIDYSVECSECQATTIVSATMKDHTSATGELRDLLEEKKWQPLMLGPNCVGVMCYDCTAIALDNIQQSTDRHLDEHDEEEGNGLDETSEEASQTD